MACDEIGLAEHAMEQGCTDFAELIQRYQNDVFRTIYARVPCREDAEDLCQDTFERAYRLLSQLRKPHAFRHWLLSIARSRCTDWIRRQGISHEAFAAIASEKPQVLDPEQSRDEPLQMALKDLSAVNQQAVWMHYFEGYAYKEMARILGVPLSTVRSRLGEARKHLRRILATSEPLLSEDFESCQEPFPLDWRFHPWDGERCPKGNGICEINGQHALCLVASGGQGAHLWTTLSANDVQFEFEVKATHPEAYWCLGACDQVEPAGETRPQTFGVCYQQSKFLLLSGTDAEPLSTCYRPSLAEDGRFHRYHVRREAGYIEVRRDGSTIFLEKERTPNASVKGILLSGSGNEQQDGMGAYFNNVSVWSIS